MDQVLRISIVQGTVNFLLNGYILIVEWRQQNGFVDIRLQVAFGPPAQAPPRSARRTH